MRWDNHQIQVERWQPVMASYQWVVMSFEQWYAHLRTRVTAYLAALETEQAAQGVYNSLMQQSVPLINPIRGGANLQTYMLMVEDLQRERDGAMEILNTERAHVQQLRTEIIKLANIRAYRGSRQPAIWFEIDGREMLLLVQQESISLIDYDANQPPPTL